MFALWGALLLPIVAAGDDRIHSASSAITAADSWSLPGILGGGLKGNDAHVDGSFFVTVPAWSTIGSDGTLGGDVVLIEPYTSWGEEGEVAMSLGLSWRHLFCGQSVLAVTRHDGHQASFFEEGGFIGANLFVDMLDTQFDNRFWQLGFGLEAGTRYLEARANYYLPLSDRQYAETFRTKTPLGTVQQSVYGEPYGTGHTVVQDHTLTTYAVTFEQLFRRYEDGMEGWDAEVAVLLPWVDRWSDVKLVGGYYSFDNQPFGPQRGGTDKLEGWKAGIEFRPVPAVVLNATWYDDELLTGADWSAGLRLEIPFEAGDLGDGKGFWARIGDAFRSRRRHLAERMTEPVRRQNAAVKVTSSSVEEKSARRIVTRVISQTKGRTVLADSIVFVDNAIGSDGNPGTYEEPARTIQQGENVGNVLFGDRATVFVQGRSEAYNERVQISQGIRLIGSGVGLPLRNGSRFHGRTRVMPSIDGGIFAENISGLVEINGFNISSFLAAPSSFYFAAVSLTNVSQGIIANNEFRGPDIGASVQVSGTNVSEMIVANNTFHDGFIGIELLTRDNARGDFTLIGNTIRDNRIGGLVILAYDASTSQVTPSGNSILYNGPGVFPVGQIGVFGSGVHFRHVGTLSNTVLEVPGDPDSLYDTPGVVNLPTGFIFINGFLHPANFDLH